MPGAKLDRTFDENTQRYFEQIGDVLTCTPVRPPLHEIEGYNLPKEDQYFRREKIPPVLERPMPGFKKKGYYETNRAQDAALRKLWHLRTYGKWIYIYGEPTYLPGAYWFELNFCPIDTGYKEYRDRDRRFYMVYEEAWKDPTCLGLLYLKHRRDGYSWRMAAIALLGATSGKSRNVGIHGADEEASKELFDKIKKLYGRLPWYWMARTKTRLTSGDIIYFGDTEKMRTTEEGMVLPDTGMESWIKYAASTETAYDKDALHLYINEEPGKSKYAKFGDQLDKHSKSIKAGDTTLGRMFAGSSVEDMGHAAHEFEEQWYLADPDKASVTSASLSGMIRLFIPSYDGREGWIGKYGESIIEPPDEQQHSYLVEIDKLRTGGSNLHMYQHGVGAKGWLEMERERARKAGDAAYINECRKNPFEPEEAFRVSSQSLSYNTLAIADTVREITRYRNRYGAMPYRQGRLEWNTKRTAVAWVDDKDGPFFVSRMPDVENPVVQDGTTITSMGRVPVWRPATYRIGALGVDPVDKDNTVGQSSLQGIVGMLIPGMEPRTDKDKETAPHPAVVIYYRHRHRHLDDIMEDVIKVCHWTGWRVNIESNRTGTINHMVSRGYKHFIYKKWEIKNDRSMAATPEGNAPGFFGTADGNDLAFQHSRPFIDGTPGYWSKTPYTLSEPVMVNGREFFRLPFTDLLDQLRHFDPAKRTKFDGVVAYQMACVAITLVERPWERLAKEDNQTEELRVYKERGPSTGKAMAFARALSRL